MPPTIAPDVLRMFWPGLVPIGIWLFGAVIAAIGGGTQRRRLFKVLLWTLPAFLLPTAWFAYIVLMWFRYGVP